MHYVLGAVKTIVAVALILVILIFILYFANQALDGGVPAYSWLREKLPVLDRFLPVDEPENTAPVTEIETIEEPGTQEDGAQEENPLTEPDTEGTGEEGAPDDNGEGGEEEAVPVG